MLWNPTGMRNVQIDGEEVIVHDEVRFAIRHHATVGTHTAYTAPEEVEWPNGKPDAVTPECAEWVEDAGIDLRAHEILIVNERDEVEQPPTP